MTDDPTLRLFEQHRSHLHAVASRMLGSKSEADDAVQEAWLRLERSDTAAVENMKGWLTTVVARVALDMLRAKKAAREDLSGDALLEADDPAAESAGAERELAMADSVGLALLVVLESLEPAERVAFVLHDLFGVAFDEIAPIVGRTSAATRQLASRARRRVQGSPEAEVGDRARHAAIVDAFLRASRGGDFEGLLAVLDPDVVFRVDAAGIAAAAGRAAQGAPLLAPEVRGARAVATSFSGRAQGARAALIDGVPGAVWAPGGVVRSIFEMRVEGGRIVGIELVYDPASVAEREVEILGG